MKNTIKPASLKIGNLVILCGVRNERKPTFRLRKLNISRESGSSRGSYPFHGGK